jgi:5-(aminomethyl)-3-furanmethanol phosphate kinase
MWIVVKVGGSLFDWPALRQRLPAWLAQFGDANVLIVPGGGAMANAVRAFDRVHHLGEEASHWLAIRALSVNARFLHALLPDARLAGDLPETDALPCPRWFVLDALPFLQADEARHGHLPHGWQVTSDAIAVRVATVAQARELILLKSIDWPGSDWAEAARADVVDDYFVEAIRQASPDLRTSVVNLRAWDPGKKMAAEK